MDLKELDAQFIWHPFTQQKSAPTPLLIERAKGAYLYTKDGRQVFDAISSWWVNLHGHCHPKLIEAVHKQFQVLEQVIFAGMSHEPAIRLGERLIKLLPSGFSRIFFSDNGSTSVEVALKTALQYWFNLGHPRKKIIAFRNAYHGDTFGAMSVSEPSPFNQAFADHMFDVSYIDPPLRTQERGRSLYQLECLLKQSEDYACMIYEPLVQGAGGMLMQDKDELDQCLQLAKKHQLICIADEVMTGFGRTGRLFASEQISTPPDIICLSKGLTGGTMPLSVTACQDWIYEAFHQDDAYKALYHGHSFTANALACAVSHASLDLLMGDECQHSIQRITRLHTEFARKLLSSNLSPCFKDVRVQGTILACEFNNKGESGYFNDLRHQMASFFLSNNLLLRPLGNVIYSIPPYCSETEDLMQVYSSIEAFADANKEALKC